MPAGTQVRTIRVVVDTKGSKDLQDIARSMGMVNKSTSSLASSFGVLKNALAGYLGFLGIRELMGLSDTMQNLENRLEILSGSQTKAKETMAELLGVADRTKQSIDTVGETYTRLQVILGRTGVSSSTLLKVTETLANSFRLSNSTAAETQATMIQLSQAFSSGVLRGQELRSVLLQNATLADALRQRFGKDLFKTAEAGGITITEVFKLLYNNMDRINTKAAQLRPTFEQSLTKAMNALKVAVGNLNDTFNLSGNFAQGLDVLLQKLPLIASLIGLIAITQIPLLITQVTRLGAVMLTLAVENPLVAALVAVSVVVVATNGSLSDMIDKFRNLGAWFVQVGVWADEAALAVGKFLDVIRPESLKKAFSDQGLKDLEDRITRMKALADQLGTPSAKLSIVPEDKGAAMKQFQDDIKKLEATYGSVTKKALKTKEVLAILNKEFINGKIGADEYNRKILDFDTFKLNKDFADGKINLEQFNEGIQKVNVLRINKEFNEGAISLERFNQKIEASKIRDLEEQLAAGKISIIQFNQEITKVSQSLSPGGSFQAGASQYLQSIGTIGQQTANLVANAFSKLEDVFLDFIKTGKFSFAQFTQAILDDLTRIIIRASIIRPLAEGILSFGTSSATGNSAGTSYQDTSNVAAKGAYFDGSMAKFASGGVVNSPTTFGYGRGKRGLMGEAGPEAILPLSRSGGGKLGVEASVTPVTINIVNTTNADIEQKETTGPSGARTIEILIHNKVKEGIANGQYDKNMNQAYGLKRKGS